MSKHSNFCLTEQASNYCFQPQEYFLLRFSELFLLYKTITQFYLGKIFLFESCSVSYSRNEHMWFSKCIFCFAYLPPERNIHFCGVTRVALPAHSGFLSFYMPCFFERSYMWTDAFFHTSRFFLRNSLVFSTNQTLSVKISPFRTKGNISTISHFPHKTKQKLFRPSSRSLLSRTFMFMMEKLENIALKD